MFRGRAVPGNFSPVILPFPEEHPAFKRNRLSSATGAKTRLLIDLDPFWDAGQTLERFTAAGLTARASSGFQRMMLSQRCGGKKVCDQSKFTRLPIFSDAACLRWVDRLEKFRQLEWAEPSRKILAARSCLNDVEMIRRRYAV